LVEHDLEDKAEEFLSRFPDKSGKAIEFRIARFMVFHKSSDPEEIIKNGREILKNGGKDQTVFKIMIETYSKMGMNGAADEMLEHALKVLPQYKVMFKKSRELKTGSSLKAGSVLS